MPVLHCAQHGAGPGVPPRVRSWACRTCGGRWWISVSCSQPLLKRVAEEVAVRSVLRGIIALAEQAPALTDDHLRAQLAGLAGMVRAGCREPSYADEAPAAHRLSVTPGWAAGTRGPRHVQIDADHDRSRRKVAGDE